MTASHSPSGDDRFEDYLDGLLSAPERAAFAEAMRADPTRLRDAELQSRIDGALGRLFAVETPPMEQLAAAVAGGAASGARSGTGPTVGLPPVSAKTPRGARAYWAGAGIVAAALMAGVLASLLWRSPASEGPLFAARPLVDVYRDAVASGFEPTYECHEPERFAATFQTRQGQPLKLLAMPSDARMLGLGYTGGLSRTTTAMLCYVDGRPVMVFVDRAANDRREIAETPGEGLHVFRAERDGLVFYEVTPLETPRGTSLLAPAVGETPGA